MTGGAVDYLLGKERSPFTSQLMADARSACTALSVKEVASDRGDGDVDDGGAVLEQRCDRGRCGTMIDVDRFCDFACVHAEAALVGLRPV
jgi:hypothetical protein